jgi:carnitine 3-dehydrogenase
MKAEEPLQVTTQVLQGEGKKMRLFHYIRGAGGKLCATVDSMLLHVDLTTRATSLPSGAVAGKLAEYAQVHAKLPQPAEAGRGVGQRG